MVRNEVPLYNTCKAILHALQFREVLFGNVVYQRIAIIEATGN